MSEQLYIIVSPTTGTVIESLDSWPLLRKPKDAKRFEKKELPKELFKRVLETFGHDDPTQWRYVGTCNDLIIKLAPQESEEL